MAAMRKNLSKIIQSAFASKVQFGEVLYPPGSEFGPREQSQFQLVLLLRGEAHIRVNAERVQALAGQVILLRPGARESFTFAQATETHHSWCSINLDLVPPALVRQLRAAPRQAPISGMMETLIALGLRSGAGEAEADLLAQLALSALSAFVREGKKARNRSAPPAPLQRARVLIEQEYATPLTVNEIARRSGISTNHLIRLFRRHLGETPATHLRRWRIDHGVRLLRETGLTISEIAFRTGFQNPFHFSRLVSQRFQCPPRELRKAWWRPGAPGKG